MPKERDLWATVRDELGPYGDLLRVENVLPPYGMYDVNYCLRIRNRPAEGWLELKQLPAWPKGETTPVAFPLLTLDQVVWGERRRAAGGRVHLLARIGDAYVLADTFTVRLLFERQINSEQLIYAAKVYSADGFPTRALLEALTA